MSTIFRATFLPRTSYLTPFDFGFLKCYSIVSINESHLSLLRLEDLKGGIFCKVDWIGFSSETKIKLC